MWREFVDMEGRTYRHRADVYDYKTPYYRVRHEDGDWEELTRTEVDRGRKERFLRGNVPAQGAGEREGSPDGNA